MSNYCIIEKDRVSNIIYVDVLNAEAFAKNGMELINNEHLHLRVGDYREGETWYRDVDGAKTEIVAPPTAQEYQSYYEAMQQEIEGGAQ